MVVEVEVVVEEEEEVVVVFQTCEQLSSYYLKVRSIRVHSSDWLRVTLSGCDWSCDDSSLVRRFVEKLWLVEQLL